MKRSVLAAAAVLLLAGCSTYTSVPRKDLLRDTSFDNVRVATIDGFEYRFSKIAILPDTLEGFYTVTVERTGETQDDVWYEDVLRKHDIPLARVVRVELIRKDPTKTALYGASIAAGVYALANLVTPAKTTPIQTPTSYIKGSLSP